MVRTREVRLKARPVPLLAFPLSLPPALQRDWSPHQLRAFTGAAELRLAQTLREDLKADVQLFSEVDANGDPGAGKAHPSAAESAEQ